MSWSICFIGNPDNIVAALQKESERLTGQSKIEFDAVKTSLANLVLNNYSSNGILPVLKLTASGHAHSENGQYKYGYTSVILEPISGNLV